jgi:hypothetical protein
MSKLRRYRITGDTIQPGGKGHPAPFKTLNVLQRAMKGFRDNILSYRRIAHSTKSIPVDRIHIALVQGAKGDRTGTRGFDQLVLGFELLRRRRQILALRAGCTVYTLPIQCSDTTLDTPQTVRKRGAREPVATTGHARYALTDGRPSGMLQAVIVACLSP